jgi:riboflavin transporter FmnP
MKNTKARLTTQTLCFIGLFGALSTVLMMFKIPLFFAPAFMKLDLAELPAILGSFMFGPVAGVCIVFIKLLLNLLINGTDSMYVGELSNLLLSSCYVLCASVIYNRHKTKKRAATALVISVIVTSIVAVVSNTFFIFPAYAVVYGLEMDALVKMAGAVNPLVHDAFTMMLWSVFPFNVVKLALVSVLTFLVYKKLHLFIMRLLK